MELWKNKIKSLSHHITTFKTEKGAYKQLAEQLLKTNSS